MRTPGIERIDAVNFSLGLINAADEARPGLLLNCRDRSVDAAIEDAYRRTESLIDAGEVEAELDFVIILDRGWRDSEEVERSMITLYCNGYIEPTYHKSNWYRFNRGTYPDARAFHEDRKYPIPGKFEMYQNLAGRFATIISGYEVEPLETLLESRRDPSVHELAPRP